MKEAFFLALPFNSRCFSAEGFLPAAGFQAIPSIEFHALSLPFFFLIKN